MQVCPRCGEENPERFRLCGFCGAPLSAPLPPQENRKTVTVVFSDLKGSTALGERLDSESLREVLNHYFARMRQVLERHGGTVEKYIGDAIMAVFGLPRVHEDDALRAVRAAADMQRALAEVNEELRRRWGVTLANRTGVNTGEVVAGDAAAGQRLVTGDTVNVAARLEQAAGELEVLIGESTYRLVRDAVEVEPLEPLELKGKADRVPAYRLRSVTRGEGFTRHLDTPMVGRAGELCALRDRFAEAVRDRRCRLVTVVGEAGVGKSRLIQELVTAEGDGARVLRGRCLPYGEGITFWPLAEVVRQGAGIEPEDTPDRARARLAQLVEEPVQARIAGAIGLSLDAFPIEETFWAARKLLERLARDRPLVVVFDDIHWAEPTFLDLITHVVESARGTPALILCSARHELLEDRPGWAGGVAGAEVLRLERLPPEDSARIVDNLLGGALPAAVGDRIVAAAEGNPLFVEQILSMLVDEGLIARSGEGTWVARPGVESFSVPPTISALIEARLDRLPAEERAVIERGSVIGPVFYLGAVASLSPEALRPRVDACVSALVGRQMVRPDASELAGERAFRFHHALIRDAAYAGLLKRTRIELHEAYADWLQRTAGSLMEHEEILGYHLEQAYRYRAELGPVDADAVRVGRRASGLLASAGRRALARGDLPAAANLLDRAISMLPLEEPVRLELLADLGEALKDLGEFARAEEVLEEAIRGATAGEDRRLASHAGILRLLVRFAARADLRADDVLREVERAVPVFEAAGDPAGLARAWRLIAALHNTAGRYGAAERAILQAIDHARAAGDPRLEARNLPVYATCAVYGPAPVGEAVDRCRQFLEQASGDRRAGALVRLALAQLLAMQGQFDRARELCREARDILVDLGDRVLAATTSIDSSRVEMLAERPEAAEAELRRDYRDLEAMGERYYLATVAGLLAHALYLLGQDGEAEELSRVTQASDEDDVESQSLWRRARAKVLARRGQLDEAELLAAEAVKFSLETDSPVLQANTLMDRAEVLRLGGRTDQAAGAARAALDLYRSKGNLVAAARASRALRELSGPPGEGAALSPPRGPRPAGP